MNFARIDFDRGEAIEMLLGHARHQDHGAGVHLGTAPAHAPGGRGGDDRERGHEFGREVFVVEARHVQLAGRDHGGGAAVHVVADPADGVLRRRPFAEHRMDVAVDQAGHHGRAAGVDHAVGGRRGGGSSAAMRPSSISSEPTSFCGCARSPVKNSPIFLIRREGTTHSHYTRRDDGRCGTRPLPSRERARQVLRRSTRVRGSLASTR